MLAGKDSDELKVEVVEIYKGHFYSVNKKICTVLFIILMPFSLLFTVTLPNPEKKRTDRRHLYWGLSIAGFYIFLFSAIIIWMEDGLFIHFKYPAPLLGFALNAPLITGPHLLHNLATLNPDRP